MFFLQHKIVRKDMSTDFHYTCNLLIQKNERTKNVLPLIFITIMIFVSAAENQPGCLSPMILSMVCVCVMFFFCVPVLYSVLAPKEATIKESI